MRHPDKPDLRIRAYREARGYTQDYMAEMLNICQSTYANLESGKTTLSVDRLLHIAEILETDFTQLLEFGNKTQSKKSVKSGTATHTAHELHVETKMIYEQLIDELRNEIAFLRSLIRAT